MSVSVPGCPLVHKINFVVRYDSVYLWFYDSVLICTRKPCCRKETARCRSCCFRFYSSATTFSTSFTVTKLRKPELVFFGRQRVPSAPARASVPRSPSYPPAGSGHIPDRKRILEHLVHRKCAIQEAEDIVRSGESRWTNLDASCVHSPSVDASGMSPGQFWSLFNVNRPIFHGDMCDKQF